MNKLLTAAAAAAFLTLTACGGQGDDAAGDNAADAAEAQAENIEEAAENTTNEAQSDALEDKADAVEANGLAQEEAIDDADGKANNQ